MIATFKAAVVWFARKLSVPGASPRRIKLNLLELEGRDTPTVNALVWTGAGDGVNWSDAANWSVYDFNMAQLTTGHTPTSSDTLYFGELGGANTSSEDDTDVTVLEIIQSNTYTGNLTIDGSVTLTVSTSITAYGAINFTAGSTELHAGSIYLVGGSINILAGVTPNSDVPLTTSLLDMVDGAALTVGNATAETTLAIDTLTMGTGTTFEIADPTLDVTVDGNITTGGTVSIASGSTLTVTGNYTQADGDLILNDACALTIQGTSHAYLSGHTTIEGNVTITADTVEIDGGGEMEYATINPGDNLHIVGNLDVSGGTFTFDDIGGVVDVSGDFSVFIGTLNMNVAAGGMGMPPAISNVFLVGGDTDLGTGGPGGPTLNLNQLTSITPPTTFSLIGCLGTGSGDFDTITASNAVLAQGFVTIVGPVDVYQVTL